MKLFHSRKIVEIFLFFAINFSRTKFDNTKKQQFNSPPAQFDQTMSSYLAYQRNREKIDTEVDTFTHVQNYHYLMGQNPSVKIKSLMITGSVKNQESTPEATFMESSEIIFAIKEMSFYTFHWPSS